MTLPVIHLRGVEHKNNVQMQRINHFYYKTNDEKPWEGDQTWLEDLQDADTQNATTPAKGTGRNDCLQPQVRVTLWWRTNQARTWGAEQR